jgi:hypothetical protein
LLLKCVFFSDTKLLALMQVLLCVLKFPR